MLRRQRHLFYRCFVLETVFICEQSQLTIVTQSPSMNLTVTCIICCWTVCVCVGLFVEIKSIQFQLDVECELLEVKVTRYLLRNI